MRWLKRVHVAKRCLSPALNADSIPRKKFFIFLVASAIEASSRRKTVSFTSSIPLESDKKNTHGQRRAISVTLRGTSFHSETGLGLWLKRAISASANRSTEQTKQASADWNQERADWSDCKAGLGLRLRESHSHIRNRKHGANILEWMSDWQRSQLQCRHEGRQNWLHAKKRTLSERQGSGRERRPKWRLLQGSKLTVWT